MKAAFLESDKKEEKFLSHRNAPDLFSGGGHSDLSGNTENSQTFLES
jgi:hypothetical protein